MKSEETKGALLALLPGCADCRLQTLLGSKKTALWGTRCPDHQIDLWSGTRAGKPYWTARAQLLGHQWVKGTGKTPESAMVAMDKALQSTPVEEPELKTKAVSKDRWRATAAQRRRYGGSTVTEFFVWREDKDGFTIGDTLEITGFGRTPGNRKTFAMRIAEDKWRRFDDS